jgi:hypothetical protein
VILPWGKDLTNVNVLKDAAVCLFGMNVSTDEEVMYPTLCPTLAVFTTDDENRAGLVASVSLDCFTNYDDVMTSISLDNLSVGDSLDFITITSRSRSFSGEREGSNSNMFLYAIKGNQLVEVNRFELEASESDEESSKSLQAVLSVQESKTLGVSDLVFETTTEEDGKIDTRKVLYAWDGESFVEKSNK